MMEGSLKKAHHYSGCDMRGERNGTVCESVVRGKEMSFDGLFK